jgi:hypothetical protein
VSRSVSRSASAAPGVAVLANAFSLQYALLALALLPVVALLAAHRMSEPGTGAAPHTAGVAAVAVGVRAAR